MNETESFRQINFDSESDILSTAEVYEVELKSYDSECINDVCHQAELLRNLGIKECIFKMFCPILEE